MAETLSWGEQQGGTLGGGWALTGCTQFPWAMPHGISVVYFPGSGAWSSGALGLGETSLSRAAQLPRGSKQLPGSAFRKHNRSRTTPNPSFKGGSHTQGPLCPTLITVEPGTWHEGQPRRPELMELFTTLSLLTCSLPMETPGKGWRVCLPLPRPPT